MFIFYFLLMVVVLGVLIFVHEFGHFITARLCGVAVKEFAIGMGPTIFSWKSKKYDTKRRRIILPIRLLFYIYLPKLLCQRTSNQFVSSNFCIIHKCHYVIASSTSTIEVIYHLIACTSIGCINVHW